MHSHVRTPLLAVLAAGAVWSCATPERALKPISSEGAPSPTFSRINATDSLLMLTDILYSDTAIVLQRTTPLPADLTGSATIGPKGGEIAIAEAGVKVVIPSGALTNSTLITMTALKGTHVAYDFQPHGLIFLKPVKVQQEIVGTGATGIAALLNGMHGVYFEKLDLSTVNGNQELPDGKETQLGYFETRDRTSIKFFIGHFSGYLVSCGAKDTR
jgi:hypothetical protein